MGRIKHRGEKGSGNVKDMRANAWKLLAMPHYHNINDAGEDILQLDELCQRLYKALKSGDAGEMASARFAFEEFYDIV